MLKTKHKNLLPAPTPPPPPNTTPKENPPKQTTKTPTKQTAFFLALVSYLQHLWTGLERKVNGIENFH